VMPFITEEIWQRLPLDRSVDSIMIAPYPREDPRLEDAAADAEMAPLIDAIEGIRNLRGENNISPAVKLPAVIQSADSDVRSTLKKWSHYLVPLAGLSSLEVVPPGPPPAHAALFTGKQLVVYVPLSGIVDLKEEQGRLTKEIARVDADLLSLTKKLSNPNFAVKAPAEVVEKDRARLDELQARRTKLQEHLKRVSPEAESGG